MPEVGIGQANANTSGSQPLGWLGWRPTSYGGPKAIMAGGSLFHVRILHGRCKIVAFW
ncbi:hypothetical protein [Prochlorococcus sp. MIT 0703]|uniref:hypothetical protein n=1 Tax=unclassified Prochlorococcus TaxID=2627481 RepID=UPI00187BF741|nr:hypothetical protein [Prochlorococcus sp. MIT 0703]